MASLVLIMLYGLVTSTLWVYFSGSYDFQKQGNITRRMQCILAHYAVCTRVTNGYIQNYAC